jgi:undecaprenyl-diphosphatase
MRPSEINLALGFAVCAAGFALMAFAIARGRCDALDRALLGRLPRRPPGARPTRLDSVMHDLSALGGDTARVIILIAAAAGLVLTGSTGTALWFVAISVGARLCVWLLKRLINRARPPEADHAVATFTTSFPSGHTLMATAMLVAAALLTTIKAPQDVQHYALALAVALSAAIGAARVYLRVHWPSDVVAGWLGGGAWAAGMLFLIDRFT